MKALALALLLLPFQQTADLSWKPTAGSELRYTLTLSSSADFGQGPQELLAKFKIKNTVKEVTDGVATMQATNEETSISIGGQELDPSMARQPDVTSKMKLDGTPVLDPQSHDQMARVNRSILATTFKRPDKPLAMGGEFRWDYKDDPDHETLAAQAKVTLKGEEKIGQIDCWKLDYVYSETTQDKPMDGIGTLWIDKTDGKLVKSVMDLHNYKSVNIMAPADAHVVMELAQSS